MNNNEQILLIIVIIFLLIIIVIYNYACSMRKNLLDINKSINNQHDYFNEILNTIQDIVVAVDVNGCIIRINQVGIDFFGFSQDEIHSKNVRDITSIVNDRIQDEFEHIDKEFNLISKYNIIGEEIFSVKDQNGLEKIMKKTVRPILKDDVNLGNIIILQDVTSLNYSIKINDVLIKIARQVINYSNLQDYFVYIKDQLKDIINLDNIFIAINNKEDNTIDLIQFDRESKVIRRTITKREDSLANYIMKTGVTHLLNSGEIKYLNPLEFKNNLCKKMPNEAIGIPLIINKSIIGALGLCTYQDETTYTNNHINLLEYIANHIGFLLEQKKWKTKMEQMAYYDELTGLPNRILFIKRLDQELITSTFNSQTIAIFYLDLDGFKQINDKHGHDIGDRFLEEVGKRLSSIKSDNTMIARIGGDEFSMYMSKIKDSSDIINFARNIVDIFRKPIIINKLELRATSSVGISFYSRDGINSIELLKTADKALYKAKAKGKNQYAFYDSKD